MPANTPTNRTKDELYTLDFIEEKHNFENTVFEIIETQKGVPLKNTFSDEEIGVFQRYLAGLKKIKPPKTLLKIIEIPPESLTVNSQNKIVVQIINLLVELHNEKVQEKNKDPEIEHMRSKLKVMRKTPISFIKWRQGKNTALTLLDIDEEVWIKSIEAKMMKLFEDFIVSFWETKFLELLKSTAGEEEEMYKKAAIWVFEHILAKPDVASYPLKALDMVESVLFMIGYIKKSDLQSQVSGGVIRNHPLVEIFEIVIDTLLEKYKTENSQALRRLNKELWWVNRELDDLDTQGLESSELEKQWIDLENKIAVLELLLEALQLRN